MERDGNILITGGSGSLGKYIACQLLKRDDVRTIRIFSRGELLQYQMKQEFDSPKLRYLIGDVRDKERLSRAMNKVETVFHCAAMKHVDVCEFNPIDAVKTNVMGTVNVVNCAIDNKVKKVMAVSSDKAVHPVNIYGATKLAMEKLIIQSNVYASETKFSCVRLGNLQGSMGSFLPLIFQKADEGGEVPVTDKDMLRYWMTMETGAEFTVNMTDMMEGGEIFIPKITAQKVVDFVNDATDGKVKIKFVGIRPGERLTEYLYSEIEKPVDMGDYLVIK